MFMNAEDVLAHAYTALKRGDRATALARVKSASRAEPLSLLALNRLTQLYLELGLLDDAAGASARVIALDANQPQAWHRHGIIELQRQHLPEARAALERVVGLNPGAAGPIASLATVLLQMGLHRLAAEQFEKALAINPAHAESHSNLAAALAVLGRFDDAIAHAKRAIAINPSYLSPYVHAAFAEADRGRCAEALAWMDRIPAAATLSAPVLTARAEILLKFDRFGEAFEASRKAVAIEPGYGDARNCMGILLAAMQREREAIAEFDRALALLPNGAVTLARKGLALVQLGEQSNGLRLLDDAQKSDPASATIRYMRAAATGFRLDEADIASMETLLADERTSSVIDRMQLHFALAGANLQRDEVSRVFSHLNAGNRLKRDIVAYDPDAEELKLATIVAAFPPSLMDRPRPADDASDPIVFVVGMPRSGTTLVEQILDSHPEIHGAGELWDLENAVRRRFSALGRKFPEAVEMLGPNDCEAIGRDYLSRVVPASMGARRVVDKMPSNSLYAGLIRLALPGARIVHCRRNPFDNCLSCYAQLFTAGQHYSYDLDELGRYYRAHDAMMAHWRQVLPEDCFFEVDYEKLVGDIDGVSRQLVEFLGLEWSPACLQFHESNRPVRTASMSQVRRPLYRSSIGRWRHFEAELAPLFKILGPAS